MKERTDIIAGYYGAARNELVAFVERRTGSHELAEDLVHDAFLRMLTTGNLLSEATLPALAFTMVRNLLSDWFRRRAYANGYADYLMHTEHHAADAAQLCSRHEVEQWIERGMARLPEQCREPYRLHIFGGMKIAEIQHTTGQNYKQLEHCLGTARKQMRLYMKRFAV